MKTLIVNVFKQSKWPYCHRETHLHNAHICSILAGHEQLDPPSETVASLCG